MIEYIEKFITIVGCYALSCYLYERLRTPCTIIYQRIKRVYASPQAAAGTLSLKERYGEWAAITGSSDGIGKAYARELARHGMNVVLIARNVHKLSDVALEIETDFSVKTKIIVADFTAGAHIYEHIESELKNIPVGLLVNNVGMAHATPGPLCKSNHSELQQLIDTNIVAVTQLSRYFLQRMISTKTKGCIVNVSSGTELQPVPYAALYGASKAFTRSLTLALQHEAARYDIDVHLLSPNFVSTKINSYSKVIMRGGLFIPDANKYARSAVSQLCDGVDETSGYFWHEIQNAIVMIFPTRVRTFILKAVFAMITDKKVPR